MADPRQRIGDFLSNTPASGQGTGFAQLGTPEPGNPINAMNNSMNMLESPPTGGFERPGFASRLLKGAGQVAEQAIPFATFLTNQNLIGQTPQVPTPALVGNANFETDLNFEPAISEIKGQARSSALAAGQNIVDPSVQANIALSSGANAQREINKVRSGELNTEAELKNREALVNTRQGNIRTGQVNKFSQDIRDRTLDIQGKTSQNVNLLQDTLQTNIRDRKLDRNDRLAFVMMSKALDTDGVISRNFAEIIQKTDPKAWAEFEAAGGTIGE